jgi:hypothetical protein
VTCRPAAYSVKTGQAKANPAWGRNQPWRWIMRPLSFVLAFAFFIAGPLFHREANIKLPNKLPGAGTFTYTGTQLAFDAPQHITMAAIR